jgi:hypothetical protein
MGSSFSPSRRGGGQPIDALRSVERVEARRLRRKLHALLVAQTQQAIGGETLCEQRKHAILESLVEVDDHVATYD